MQLFRPQQMGISHQSSTLVDSENSTSYINAKTAEQPKLKVITSEQNISMALSTMTCREIGHCVTDLTLNGRKYTNIKLGVLKHLCSDLLLGGDFQSQHERVIFQYTCLKSELVVKDSKLCTVTAANVKPCNLFKNLAPECKSNNDQIPPIQRS